MKLSLQTFAFLSSSLGLFAINFGVSLPAKAAIVCETNTINNYPNGSLENCLLGQNITVQVSSFGSGTSTLYCQAKNNISFDDKGQFESCTLSDPIQIRTGNSVKICLAEYRVNVSVSNDGNQSITCQR